MHLSLGIEGKELIWLCAWSTGKTGQLSTTWDIKIRTYVRTYVRMYVRISLHRSQCPRSVQTCEFETGHQYVYHFRICIRTYVRTYLQCFLLDYYVQARNDINGSKVWSMHLCKAYRKLDAPVWWCVTQICRDLLSIPEPSPAILKIANAPSNKAESSVNEVNVTNAQPTVALKRLNCAIRINSTNLVMATRTLLFLDKTDLHNRMKEISVAPIDDISKVSCS